MAYTGDKKPLELTEITALASDDTIIVGDTSDTSEVAKYITKTNLESTLNVGGAVDSVNTQTGVVVLDADDIDDSATTNKFTTAGDISKLAGIEALADVTDATNVNAAGAVMESDFTPAHSLIVQQSGTGSPGMLTLSDNEIVGKQAGDIVGLTATQVRTTINVEDGADVTDTTNVTAAGALMDSEVTNLAQVKAFDSSDYATATQGTTADSAVQPSVGENLTDVQELRLDGTPDTDHSATGPTTDTFNAGATISAGEVVYMHTDGEWALADASATATTEKLIGIALEAGTDGASMLTALPGSFVRDDTWAWTAGDTLYLSLTAGDLSATVTATATDEVSRVIGYAVSADVIYLQPQQGVIHA